MNFWQKLKKPFFVLAPMHEVTDSAFRQIVAGYQRPDVFLTEFISADGLCHPISREKIIRYYLGYSKKEKPIVSQVWGSRPQKIFEAAKIIAELGFDGVDINMGCPDKAVVKSGGGAALILNPKLAQEIVLAAKKGAPNLPVSVKTRLGFNKNIVEDWIGSIMKAKPEAVIIHGRLKTQNYQAPADWDSIGKAAKIVQNSGALAIGNGDVKNIYQAREKANLYGLDGVMIGRGVLGNPWFFDEKRSVSINREDRLKVAIKHSRLFEKVFKNIKPFHHIRKHLAAYISNFPGSKELRFQLM